MSTLDQIGGIVSERAYSVTEQVEVTYILEATNFLHLNKYKTAII